MKRKIKNILVFGCSGLLGKSFIDHYKNEETLKIYAFINKTKIKSKNIKTISLNTINLLEKYIKKNSIDTIMNFAALTNIEYCKKKKKLSKKVNYDLPINLAKLTKKLNLKYIFISTDNFNFRSKKLKENEKTQSLNNYGYHKKKSENDIIKLNSKSLIIRTNFYCYGNKKRKSFSDTILDSLKSNNKIELFKDVYYTPIYTKFLFKYIFLLIKNKKEGIYNICSNEKITKFKFGKKLSQIFKLNKSLIKASYLKDRKDLTRRPFNMAMSNNKLKKTLNIKIPSIDHQIKVMKKDLMSFKT